MTYIIAMFAALFTSNVVLTQSLGLCPYVGVSKRLDNSFKLSLSVLFVLTISTMINFVVYNYVLVPLKVEFLASIVAIVIIATLVQCIELLIKKISPKLHEQLGIYLPLITTNCVVLGITLETIMSGTFLMALVTSVFSGLGFMLAICFLASIRISINERDVPKISQGLPIVLILAGFLAMAFNIFNGMVVA